RARRASLGLLPQRADERDEVSAAHLGAGQAGHLAEQENYGNVPRAYAEVLLRPIKVWHVPGAVGDQLPDGAGGCGSRGAETVDGGFICWPGAWLRDFRPRLRRLQSILSSRWARSSSGGRWRTGRLQRRRC